MRENGLKTVCYATQVFVIVISPLQALHITVGLLNIGLGAITDVWSSPYPFWLGGMVSKDLLMTFFLTVSPKTRVGAFQLTSNKCSHTGQSGNTELTLK